MLYKCERIKKTYQLLYVEKGQPTQVVPNERKVVKVKKEEETQHKSK